jgi:hypothetical protein
MVSVLGRRDSYRIVSSRWDRIGAVVVVFAAVGAAAMSRLDLLAVLLLCLPLLLLARALWVRRVEASNDGLRFSDGLVIHHLGWSDVDAIIVCPRSFFVQPAVQVLHHGRFIDALPLPGDGFGRRQRTELEAVAAALNEVRASCGGSISDDWCPVRIVGGVRWRMGINVVRVDATGRLDWLIAPAPRTDLFVYLFRGSARRREAEAVRAQEAMALGYSSEP